MRKSRVPAALHFDEVQQRFPSRPLKPRNIDLDLACLIYTSGYAPASRKA